MAAITSIAGVKANALVDIGMSATGARRTASISMGKLNKDTFDADKLLNIEMLLEPVLERSVVELQKVETSNIRSDD